MALDRINATALLDGGVTTADLATQTGNVDFADNARIRLGDSQDLQVYHDGIDSVIHDFGTGNLRILADDFKLENAQATATLIYADAPSGAVSLYNSNAVKLATTSTGVSVTGNATFADSGKAVFGAGSDLEIYHNGTENIIDSNVGTLVLRSPGAGTIEFRDQGAQVLAQFNDNSDVKLFYNNNEKLATTSSGCDITGTVTVDGLTVDGGSRFNDYINFGGAISTPQTAAAIYRPADNQLAFSTANSERVRMDNSGNLLVGATTDAGVSGSNAVSIRTAGSRFSRNTTSSAGQINFYNPNGQVGNINTNGSSTNYVTSSDYRLKENVTADWDATTRLKQLNPVRFNFIADADTTVDGFLAHEVQTVVPEAISGTHNGMRDEEYEVTPAVLDEDGNEVTPAVMATRSVPDYQGIDQGKLVPLLVKSLQEALDKIDTLETRLEALENA
jgi:uncharacterized protein (DUF1330 family)